MVDRGQLVFFTYIRLAKNVDGELAFVLQHFPGNNTFVFSIQIQVEMMMRNRPVKLYNFYKPVPVA